MVNASIKAFRNFYKNICRNQYARQPSKYNCYQKKKAIITLAAHDISLRMCKYRTASPSARSARALCFAISAIKSNKSCAIIKAYVRELYCDWKMPRYEQYSAISKEKRFIMRVWILSNKRKTDALALEWPTTPARIKEKLN